MTTTQRTAMVAQAEWAIAHEASIHYAQDRPIPYDRFKAHKLPITTDCSGFVSCLAFCAGVPDPNGQDYNGQGFTGTLMQHLEHITKGEVLAGDFLTYGPYPGEHVCMALESVANHPDPMLVSHGQEAGPLKIRASVEAKAHNSPVTYLRSVPIVSVHFVWDVRNGRNELVAKGVKHPALWAMHHRKAFRKYGQLTYHRRAVAG